MYKKSSSRPFSSVVDRVIAFGEGVAPLPERLLLAHARGEVLFVVGAGASIPAGVPDFRHLVIQVYADLDPSVHSVLELIEAKASRDDIDAAQHALTTQQKAEVRRFEKEEYDVVLGMLERRTDTYSHEASKVRRAIDQRIRSKSKSPASLHDSLMRLADRGVATAIMTTNFERLLQVAARSARPRVQTYSLGNIPRPGRREDFGGVMHIHGVLDPHQARTANLVITDQDFGEYYLRRRVVPDLIYDAARLYHLVLIGYGANDPPMRYLLNAVAADGVRFTDVKERYALVPSSPESDVIREDWYSRGITPIEYDSSNQHAALRETLAMWAKFSPFNGNRSVVDREIRRIVKEARNDSSDVDRDLFDHLIRRGDPSSRAYLAALASKCGADFDWLDSISSIAADNSHGAS